MLPYVWLFGYAVQSYYLCAALAGISGFVLSAVYLRQEGLGAWRYLLPLCVAASALAGARLLNYCLNPGAYNADFPLWSLSYRKLSLMGGLVCGVPSATGISLAKRQSPWRVLDDLTLPAGVGIVWLKLGCFLNGCCIGRPTEGPFGVVFPANETYYDYLDTLPLLSGHTRTVYPVQLFELLGAGLGLVLILPLCRRRKYPAGVQAALYALWFSLVRLAVHPLRAFPYASGVITTLYPLFYGAILLLLSLMLMLLFKRERRSSDVLCKMRKTN